MATTNIWSNLGLDYFDETSLAQGLLDIHNGRILVNTLSRVVPCDGKNEKKISCHNFKNYGSSYDAYPQPYLALASAIGMERREIEILMKKLANVIDAAIRDFCK